MDNRLIFEYIGRAIEISKWLQIVLKYENFIFLSSGKGIFLTFIGIILLLVGNDPINTDKQLSWADTDNEKYHLFLYFRLFLYLGRKGLTSSAELFFLRVWSEVQKLTLRLFKSIQMPGADSAEETELQVIWKIFHWRTRRNFCYKNSDLAWAWCLCLRYRSYKNVSSLKS